WSEILFPDDAILTDHEGLDSGDSVLRWSSDERETADHRSLDHIVQLTKRSRRSLTLQDLEEVAVVRFITVAVTALNCLSYVFANWSVPGAIRVLPGKAILLAGGADDLLGVLIDVVALSFLQGVLVLSVHIPVTESNSIKLILTDPADQDLALARSGVKAPLPGGTHDWYRKQPVLGSYRECCVVVICLVDGNGFLLSSHRSESRCPFLVASRFTGVNNLLALRTNNRVERRHIKLFSGIDDGVRCFFGGGKRLAPHDCSRSLGG